MIWSFLFVSFGSYSKFIEMLFREIESFLKYSEMRKTCVDLENDYGSQKIEHGGTDESRNIKEGKI